MSKMLSANIEQFAKLLFANVISGVSTLAFGHPGLGKTDVSRAIGRKLPVFKSDIGESVFVLSTTEYTPIEVGGLYHICPQTGRTKRALYDLIPIDRPVFILIDEFSDCPVYEQSGWYKLLLEQSIGDQKLFPGSYVCAAANRPEDNAASREVSKAAIGRCCCVTLRADYRALLKYAYANSWNRQIISFLNCFGSEVIDNGFNPDSPYGGSTPRDFSRLNKLETLGQISADPAIAELQIVGNIDTDAGAKYMAYRSLSIPSPDLVFNNAKTAPVFQGKNETPMQFAYCSAIVGAMQNDPKHYQAVTDYCLRLDRIAGASMAFDAYKMQPSYATSAAFAPIVNEYQDLFK